MIIKMGLKPARRIVGRAEPFWPGKNFSSRAVVEMNIQVQQKASWIFYTVAKCHINGVNSYYICARGHQWGDVEFPERVPPNGGPNSRAIKVNLRIVIRSEVKKRSTYRFVCGNNECFSKEAFTWRSAIG